MYPILVGNIVMPENNRTMCLSGQDIKLVLNEIYYLCVYSRHLLDIAAL